MSTILIRPNWNDDEPVARDYPFEFPVPEEAVVSALKEAGYIVIHHSGLPEVTESNDGNPKLPSHWGQQNTVGGRDKSVVFMEEALGKLALGNYWAKRAAVLEKRQHRLVEDLKAGLGPQHLELQVQHAADYLLERGWRR